MPDLFMRMQVASKAVTLGAGSLLLAAAVFFDACWIAFRAVVAMVFFSYSPGSHPFARSGVSPYWSTAMGGDGHR